ncbi:MAG TPA: hypothetical protein V6C58_25475 [Allocoleopsis sp.]
MPNVIIEQDLITEKITPIVDKLMPTKSLFQERLNQTEIIEDLAKLFRKNYTNSEFMSIPDDELYEIIHDVMIFEATSGILNDLTEEQLRMFDESVGGN